MILAFHPLQTAMPGQERPIPADWSRFVVPWSNALYKVSGSDISLIQDLVNEHFGVYIWTLNIKNKVCLYPTARTPTIALQFMISGEIHCERLGYGKKILEEGSFEMFYMPIGFSEAWFEPGFYESLHIELQPAYLEELISIRPEIRELIYRLLNSSAKGMSIGMANSNYKSEAILKNLRTCEKKGAALLLEMHKFILELLSEYFSAIQQQTEDLTPESRRHRKVILQVRSYIMKAPNIRDHSIENIARRFHISQSVLKRAFKNQVKMTISRFVHQQMMNKAVYLLSTTDKTIDDIADELGYEWRSSFDQAFKDHYHYSPVDLRNDPNS